MKSILEEIPPHRLGSALQPVMEAESAAREAEDWGAQALLEEQRARMLAKANDIGEVPATAVLIIDQAVFDAARAAEEAVERQAQTVGPEVESVKARAAKALRAAGVEPTWYPPVPGTNSTGPR